MENQTSGPWYGKNASGGQGLVYDEKTGRNIAVVYDEKDTELIAAAPDLLIERDRLKEVNAELVDALGQLLDRLDHHGVLDIIREEGPIEDAREALERAREFGSSVTPAKNSIPAPSGC